MIDSFINNDDLNVLYEKFSEYMNEIITKDYWLSGNIQNAKIHWSTYPQVKKENADFLSSNVGIYIWGGKKSPLYIGKTTNSFNNRFSRYLGGEKSQCGLANKYELQLIADGMQGFPSSTNKTSLVRKRGSIRFAKEGLDNVWVSILPVRNLSDIAIIEAKLIKVAELWNHNNNFETLLNKEYKPNL